jgi:hypothetical protein
VWGAVVGPSLFVYTERRTRKARNIAANPAITLHLESGDDVLIVQGSAQDLGEPSCRPDVLAAFEHKYTQPGDARYLPSADPSFDVLYVIRPQRAVAWRLSEFDSSQQRWSATDHDDG